MTVETAIHQQPKVANRLDLEFMLTSQDQQGSVDCQTGDKPSEVRRY